IFLSYDIPYFIDKSIELKNTELGRFISAILKGLVYGFMEEDLNSIIFNYYFGINDDSEKQAVYKFVSRLRPSGVKWLDKTYDFASEVVLNAIKKIKEKFDFIISTFKACKTGKDFVSATNCILSYFNVEQMTDELASVMKEDLRANKILGQVYGKTVELLEQILKLSPNTEYDELSFSKLLQNGLDACKINLVPQSVDCVFIGDINNSSFERKDIMFIAGLNMGVAPLVSYDLGIVTDKDIDNLSSKYLIEPKISQINMRARQKLFEICLLAKKNLILSYLVVDNAGNELKPSNVITSISKMFYFENGKQFVPFMIENDLHLQNELYHFIEGKGEKGGGKSYTSSNDTQVIVANKNDDLNKKASFKHFVTFIANKKNVYKYMLEEKSNEKILYNILQLNGEGEYAKYLLEMPKIIKEKAKNSYAKDLFFENGKTSATEITEFYACPYKHFVNKGLKLIEDLPFSLNKMDIGKILHRVCELFAKSIMHKKVLTNDEFDTISKHIINQIKQEYKNIFEDESNRFIIASLLKEAEKLMQKLNYFAKNSSFDIAKTEYRFTPFEIKNDIKSVKLSGQIDRLDCYDNKCIVIDYKTGNSDLKIKDIYYGIKIQLLLYALAITKESNLQVAGFGYYPIKDKYVKNNQGVIEDYKVNGYYLNEYDVLKAMDNTLIDNENCNSQLYNFKITYKKAGISFSNNLIEREKVAKLINYVNTLLESAVCNILNGEISVSPFVDGNQSPCGFCSYKGICKKDLFVKERNISNKKLEDII
ncbi:MAG: PD-(D/E)XK nuclease family protein, partial [Christensenellales bacterium]